MTLEFRGEMEVEENIAYIGVYCPGVSRPEPKGKTPEPHSAGDMPEDELDKISTTANAHDVSLQIQGRVGERIGVQSQ